MIADDHKIFRDGIISIMEDVDDIDIIQSASNGHEVLALLSKRQPDVILMDISMEGISGIELTKVVKEKYSSIQVLMLSMHSESSYIIKSLEAGALGYLLKDAGIIEVIAAIRAVTSGNTYYSQQVSAIFFQYISKGSQTQKLIKGTQLTPREIEVLKLIADEYSNPEIAKELFISIRTVDTHRRNLLDKLGAKNTAGLVKYALKKGLV